MNLSKFDPWSAIGRDDRRAYRAYRAYPQRHLGTLGTIGTGRSASLDDFEERSAVIAICSVVDRTTARRQAAVELGYSSATELYDAAIADWRKRFLTAKPSNANTAKLVRQALALCEGPWIHRLVALGWDDVSLFAVCADAESSGGFIQAAKGGHIIAATANTIYFSSPHTQQQSYHRFDAAAEECNLLWDERVGHRHNGLEESGGHVSRP